MDEVYLRSDALERKTFSEQTTINNYALWQKFFPANNPAPANLICLEQETLVMQLILNYHLDQDTTIYHILFDATYDPLMIKYFENVMGAFSIEQHWGSYLFWGMPKDKKYRVQLWKKGNWLVADDESYKVEFTPTALRAALEAREIFPTTLLDFIVLSFYYGLKCVGGFNQINYLTQMKNNYIKMQVDRGNYKSIEVCARAQTKEMNDGFTFAFLRAQQQTYAATGLDFTLYNQSDTWQRLVQTIKQITVEEAFYPLLPELYRVIYGEKDRLPELNAITDADLMEISGVSKKIIPCVTL
ncbi:MAG: hypothetical protein ACD_43C00065G0001 [uncultured bacterium]|nr:MAG: hypothetical protein ACD_43C00065G0001 [uncultured bacterium]